MEVKFLSSHIQGPDSFAMYLIKDPFEQPTHESGQNLFFPIFERFFSILLQYLGFGDGNAAIDESTFLIICNPLTVFSFSEDGAVLRAAVQYHAWPEQIGAALELDAGFPAEFGYAVSGADYFHSGSVTLPLVPSKAKFNGK